MKKITLAEVKREGYTGERNTVIVDILADSEKVGQAMYHFDAPMPEEWEDEEDFEYDESDLEIYVESIFIDETHRNFGHGTAALMTLKDMYSGLYLAPDNADSQRLFERIGKDANSSDFGTLCQGYGVYSL
jgi:GNAT superfamily N-acetyltransferase